MWWLLAACTSSICFCTLAFSTLVPLTDGDTINFLFVWPTPSGRLAAVVSGVFAPLILFAGVQWAARHRPERAVTYAMSGRWLAPLSALGSVVLGIAPAIPGVGDRGAVLGYFFYSLRWWWLIVFVAWTLVLADWGLGGPLRRRMTAMTAWPDRSRLLMFDALLFVVVIGSAFVTMPGIRSSDALRGDEPKYLRYCELWYQGGGLAVSQKRPFAEQPLDRSSALFQNVVLFAGALTDEARALRADLRQFATGPAAFRWNRVTSQDAFVNGKSGGVYQIHQPGVSAVLFPGYFVDRSLLALTPNSTGEFPLDLPVTNLTMLLIYGACAVALFRFLRNALVDEKLAAVWTVIGMLTLPTAAFALQFYPELPAALIIILAANVLLFSRRRDGWRLAAAGLACGALAWFHPRFLLVTLSLSGLGAVSTAGRARWMFLASVALPLAFLGLFAYHVTGSWLPNALWAADGQGLELTTFAFVRNATGYILDRSWGLLPHALWISAAIPGLFVLTGQSAGRAAFVTVTVLALLIPAAGHSLNAAGTTPDRLVMAAVPLLTWPAAVFVRRLWSSLAIRTLATVAAVVSLETAVAYNWNHQNIFGVLKDTSTIGWRPNLAFPLAVRGDAAASVANLSLVAAVSIAIATLCVVAFSARRNAALPGRGSSVAVPVRLASVVAIVIGWFTVATAANGDWTSRLYRMGPDTAKRVGARALLAQDPCRLCFSSERGAMRWTRLTPNPARDPRLEVSTRGLEAVVNVRLDGDEQGPGFGPVRVEFGDGASTDWVGVVEASQFAHTYSGGGRYQVVVSLRVPNGAIRSDRKTIEIAPGR